MNLRELGCDIFFAHIEHEKGDKRSMANCWKEKFFSIPYDRSTLNNKMAFEKIIRKLKYIVNKVPLSSYMIDDWYDSSIEEEIKRLSKRIDPHIVIVVYVFFSKILECFPKHIVKIIDTQDIFSDRHQLYEINNQQPLWFSTTEEEENKGLRRADMILAIQSEEARILSKRLENKKVIIVGHTVKLKKPLTRTLHQNILYLASKNPINIQGYQFIKEAVFPILKKQSSKAKLILAGDICEVVDSFECCTKLGRVNESQLAYDMADIVLNPVCYGTGLKIKSIEALGYSKPLVTTPSGAAGIESGVDQAYLIAESAEDFAEAILKVFSNEGYCQLLSRNAYEFAKAWNQNCLEVLQTLIA